MFLCLVTWEFITCRLTFRCVESSICRSWMCSYLQNNISHDMSNSAIIPAGGKTAGGQEEFQIFDKHVKAVKPGLVIMPILLLLLST